jgi:dynein heavy chain
LVTRLYLADVLESWCIGVEKNIKQEEDDGVNSGTGPMTELDFWRRRMQRFNSITEQLKTKESKFVVRLLTELTKNPKDTRGKSVTLLHKWKSLDLGITEVSNEAKDNVKYLSTLEKFIEPLYLETPDIIRETVPPMLNAIKMVHTIARYYNTTKRMQALFTKISNQMILKCRQYICPPDGDDIEILWKADAADLVRRMEHCLKLNEVYQEQYRLTKDKLQTIPRGKQFDFNQMAM